MSDFPAYPDIRGTETLPYGVKVGHTWHEIGLLLRTILVFKVRGFVELGVHEGGLASIIIPRCRLDHLFSYLGVEVNLSLVRPEVRNAIALEPGAKIIEGDCFAPDVIEQVRRWTIDKRRAGTVLIYCDDGDKPRELETYWPLIAPGDVIGVHDFFDPMRTYSGELLGYGRTLDFPLPEAHESDIEAIIKLGAKPIHLLEMEGTRIAFCARPE